MFFKKNHRRHLLALNLVALIDISAMIIIFLIMGSVFGESSVQFPEDVKLPKSDNNESVEVAPQVVLHKNNVRVEFLKQNVSLSQYLEGREPSENHERDVKRYIASIPAELRKSGILLNFVADENTPYEHIFQVIRFYRKAGFQSVLFIAQGK